jgi:hypothetical protein
MATNSNGFNNTNAGLALIQGAVAKASSNIGPRINSSYYSPPQNISGASGNSYDTVGTGYVTNATTIQKLLVLYKTNPSAALRIAKSFGIKLPSPPVSSSYYSSTSSTPKPTNADLDRYTQNLMRTLFAAELNVHYAIGGTTNAIAGSIHNLNTTITGDIRGIKDELNKDLAPVSSALGGVIGPGARLLRNPVDGASAIGRSMAHLIDKVNPGFSDRLEASMKKMKADDLQHLGTNILGGIRSLASTVDSLLSVPLSIASDIYNGLMEIVKEISDLLDSVVSGLMDLIFGPKGLLDSLLPMADIMDFLQAVSEVAGVVGSIGGAFSGLSTVTGAVGQIGNFSSTALGTLSNPASLATSMLPAGASQFTSGLRNPQQLVSQLVPPSINQQLGKISSLPGLGFVGNLGYNIGGTLESMQGGILTGIVDKFSSQLGAIGAQLGKPSSNKPATDLTQSYPPTIQPSSVNPNVATVKTMPVILKPTSPVLAEITSSSPLPSFGNQLSPAAAAYAK